MLTFWTYLTRQIFPNPESTIAQNYSSVILFFISTLFNSGEKYSKSAFAPTSHGLQQSDKIWDAGGFVTTFNKPLCSNCWSSSILLKRIGSSFKICNTFASWSADRFIHIELTAGGITTGVLQKRSQSFGWSAKYFLISVLFSSVTILQKSGGKAHGFNRGMKAKKLFAIIGQWCRILSKCCTGNCSFCVCVLVYCMIYCLYQQRTYIHIHS